MRTLSRIYGSSSPVAGVEYAGAGVLKSGGGCGRVPITRRGWGAGGSVSERGSKGGLAPEWMDGGSHGQSEGERDHTETVCSERENTAEPTQPREILIVSSLG